MSSPPSTARPVSMPLPGSDSTLPFLVRYAVARRAGPTPRGETTVTKAVETSDEQ